MSTMVSTDPSMRSDPRASTRVEVELEARLGNEGVLTPCVLRNVSRGGAFADVAGLAFGTDVMLWFRLPGSDSVIEVGAVVRWSTPGGVGLQFGGLRAKDAWALGRFLEAARAAGAGVTT